MTAPLRTAVVGAGTMGTDIATVLALTGCDVVLQSRRAEARTRFLDDVARHRERRARRGGEVGAVRTTADFEGFEDRAIVIEAVAEDPTIKAETLARLEAACPPAALIASTTSSLTIRSIAAMAAYPERVLGLHFFNPARFVRLVEVVSTPETAAARLADGLELLARIERVPVRVADRVGFLVNRLILPAALEGCRAYAEHAATPAEIDAACVAWGMLVGPCTMLDMVGLDVALAICRNCERTLGPRYAPPPILERCVAAGRLGRKSGRGIFAYSRGRPEPDPSLDAIRRDVERGCASPSPTRFTVARLMVPLIDEAIACAVDGVASAREIDLAMTEVTGMREGPLAYRHRLGREGYRALVDGIVADLGDRFGVAAVDEEASSA